MAFTLLEKLGGIPRQHSPGEGLPWEQAADAQLSSGDWKRGGGGQVMVQQGSRPGIPHFCPITFSSSLVPTEL